MKTRWWIVLCAIPAALGVVLAGVFAVALKGYQLTSATPLAIAALLAGLAVSGVVVAVLLVRRGIHRAREAGRQEGAQQQRESHHRFLARLDHELKNPVTAIRAAAAASRAHSEDPHLALIDAQSARLAALVTELRKLAELEHQAIEHEPVNLEELAADVVTAVSEQLSATPAAGTRNFTVEFPRAPWPLPTVSGDTDLLFVALYNLVSNAVKYSGPDATITVRGSEENGSAVIEVADTGMGIPAEELALVWDELARGRNAQGIAGSGLGLALVDAVVKRHNGNVSLRSREGQGTSVRLSLPLPSPRP